MRIRSTKPEFWRSERIASVSWDARLVLKGLESYVDDNGVGKDDIALIVGDVFPRDMLANPRDTYARVSEAISELHQAGLLWRYEVDGTRLLFVSWWEDVQRIDKPGKGRFPRPDGTMNYRDSEIRESVASPRETVAPGTGEQGNRGTEESSSLTLVEGGVGGDPHNLPAVAHSAPGAPAAKAPRGSRLPDGWMPDDETIAAMRQQFPHVDLRAEHEKFTDYWRGVAGAKGRKADWTATWRNWIRRAAENAPRTSASAPAASNGLGKPSQKALGWEKAGEALIAELEGRR
ncbi:RepA-like replication initiator [Mycobacterium phage Bunnies]|uniref:RepA-like replication initiator n=1 Tax=Mycobacterium phage Ksquared TaxID=2015833 RepID=A0A222ZKS9_9CAUD|nr:replication initiation protein [Mycobacterium phage Ksquared]ASR84995.1 RepA-like replication initiator [Mycobacterium phage Ksquared]QDK01258.1 RepA-like replication initiator [Mycobacterium phage Bunnies]